MLKGYIKVKPQDNGDVRIHSYCKHGDIRTRVYADRLNLVSRYIKEDTATLLTAMHCDEVEVNDLRLDD